MPILTTIMLLRRIKRAFPLDGIHQVKRSKRFDAKDLREALRDARKCRPFIPYQVSVPYTCGRVKALFIGINYMSIFGHTSGCVGDIKEMLNTLQRAQFPISECCILADERQFPNVTADPTHANIIQYLAWLVHDVRPGDVLFFHYSGRGGKSNARRRSGRDYNHCILPMDYKRRGGITEDNLFDILISTLPAGVRLTAVIDCCEPVNLLELPYTYLAGGGINSSSNQSMQPVRDAGTSNGDVVLFTGSSEHWTRETNSSDDEHFSAGAVTQAFMWTLLNSSGLTYLQVLQQTREMLRGAQYHQVLQLSSTKPLSLYTSFSLFGPLQPMQGVPQQYYQPESQPQPYYQQPPPM